MTHASKPAPRVAAIPGAALAALLLAGCSTGHIGESWQCPLAEGGLCDSVAAADPAVPDPSAARGTVLAEPLWRVRAEATETSPAREPGPATETACPADCEGGFDPLAWLARLLGAEHGEGDAPGSEAGAGGPASEGPRPAHAVAGPQAPASQPVAARTQSHRADQGAAARAEPAAVLPAESGPLRDEPARDGPEDDGLRTGEILARIWIAPFVDADGVYREASHVRVVLEPAGWRLP